MAMDFEQDNDKIKMLLEQMNKQQQQAKPLGQQSMGGGLFAPSKTDMGPIGGMADAVGQINPIAGAASKALLGANEAVSGAIGGVLDAPFRAIERVGRSIKGLRPIPPGERNGASSSAGSKMLGGGADLMGALVNQAGSTSASSQPPPSLSEPQVGSADWKPSPEANRIAIASAISPGAGLSQWSGEIDSGPGAPPTQGAGGWGKRLPGGYQGAPPAESANRGPRPGVGGWGERGATEHTVPGGISGDNPPVPLEKIAENYDAMRELRGQFPNSARLREQPGRPGYGLPLAISPQATMARTAQNNAAAEEERRRQELMNQYNPYARRGINPG